MPFIEVNDLRVCCEFHGAGPNLLHISGSGGDLLPPDRSPWPAMFSSDGGGLSGRATVRRACLRGRPAR